MISLEDARNAVDKLTFEDHDQAERIRTGQIILDYLDHVGAENTSLDMALTDTATKSATYFADASQKDDALRTLRGVVGQCKGELAELIDAATRACGLFESRPMTVDEADAIAAVRAAMKGRRAHEYMTILSDSVRKFDALTIMHRMLRKLRVSGDVYRAADEWAKKRLRL